MRDQREESSIDLPKFNKFVLKNWFTIVGIIIILLAVLYDQNTVAEQVKANVDECNKHWRYQLEVWCGAKVYEEANFTLEADFYEES